MKVFWTGNEFWIIASDVTFFEVAGFCENCSNMPFLAVYLGFSVDLADFDT